MKKIIIISLIIGILVMGIFTRCNAKPYQQQNTSNEAQICEEINNESIINQNIQNKIIELKTFYDEFKISYKGNGDPYRINSQIELNKWLNDNSDKYEIINIIIKRNDLLYGSYKVENKIIYVYFKSKI